MTWGVDSVSPALKVPPMHTSSPSLKPLPSPQDTGLPGPSAGLAWFSLGI